MTLLEKAKEVEVKKRKTFAGGNDKEMLELSLAYLSGTVSIQQVRIVLATKSSSSAMHQMAYQVFKSLKSGVLTLNGTSTSN